MSILKTVQRNKEGEKKPTRHFSNLQEKSVAKAVGGKQSKNSGATFNEKSDVSIDGLFNLECKTKTTKASQITIHEEWILKNRRESLYNGRPYDAVVFSFGPGEENHYIIDEQLFLKLVEVLKDEQSK